MVRIVPPSSRNAFSGGIVLSAVTRPICDRYGSGTVDASMALVPGASSGPRDQIVGDDQDVEPRAASRRPASGGTRPGTGTRTAPAASGSTPTASSRRSGPTGRCGPATGTLSPGRPGRHRRAVTPSSAPRRSARPRRPVLRRSRCRRRPGAADSATRAPRRRAVGSRPGRRRSRPPREETRGIGQRRHRRRRRDERRQLLERAVEAVEDAVELHAHLERQRLAGRVVGRRRRAAGVGEVVRVVLRLEHVEHVRRGMPGPSSRRRSRRGTSCRRPSNSAVARWTVTPVPSSVLTNLVAVRKSGWSAGRM